MLLYQQQQHKTTLLCYSISRSNTKPHDHITLSAAATQNHMTMLYYPQQQQKNHITMLYYQQQQQKTT
jgi:uncharacterized protein YeaO (DUF488 family)